MLGGGAGGYFWCHLLSKCLHFHFNQVFTLSNRPTTNINCGQLSQKFPECFEKMCKYECAKKKIPSLEALFVETNCVEKKSLFEILSICHNYIVLVYVIDKKSIAVQ